MRKKSAYPKGIHEEMNRALKQGEIKEGFQALEKWLKDKYPNLDIPKGTINSWVHNYRHTGDVCGRPKPTVQPSPKPEPKTSSSASDIADALLVRVVKAIDDSDFKDGQLLAAKKNIARLEDEQRRLTDELSRILKIHNEQVSSRDVKLIQTVGDVETLMKRAKLR